MTESPSIPNKPVVTAVIVVYRSAQCILDCLASLEPHVREGLLEVVVVDNASPDDSAERVRANCPWARIVVSDRNRGFAGGVNLGLRAAKGDYFLLLNPDALMRSGTLPGLLEYLKSHSRVAVAAPRVVRRSGEVEVSTGTRPTFGRQAIEAFGLFLFGRWVPALRLTGLPPVLDGPVAVDVVVGCCMMIPRWAIEKIGELDENYFMYLEEIDWCVMAREAGFEVHYVPQFDVIHDRGQGGANLSLTPIDGERGLDYFFDKHHEPYSKAGLRWIRRFHYLSRSAWLTVRRIQRRPGADLEAKRHWRSFVQSFRPAPIESHAGSGDRRE